MKIHLQKFAIFRPSNPFVQSPSQNHRSLTSISIFDAWNSSFPEENPNSKPQISISQIWFSPKSKPSNPNPNPQIPISIPTHDSTRTHSLSQLTQLQDQILEKIHDPKSISQIIHKFISRDTSYTPDVIVHHLLEISCEKLHLFDYVLDSYIVNDRISEAAECFESLVKRGLVPGKMCVGKLLSCLIKTSVTSSTSEVVDACLEVGKYDEAEEYFREVKYRGIQLDATMYDNVIRGFCKEVKCDAACKYLEDMKEMGWIPFRRTYASVIEACLKEGNVVKALTLKDEMVSYGMPMEDIYGVLVKFFCRNGNLKMSCELYEEMKDKGIVPSVEIFNTLINVFLDAGSWVDAVGVFDEVVKFGVANTVTHNILIQWLCKKGRVFEACDLCDDMVKIGVEPSIFSYNYLIHGYCRQGNVDSASGIFSKVIAKGIKPNLVTYSTLIHGYFKKGEIDRAISLYDQMQDARITPTCFTCNTIISGLCKCGRTSEACDMLDVFMKDGFIPTSETYTSIISGYIKEGSMDIALETYKNMCENGISPSVATYTSLIDGYCKSNNLKLALKLWAEMRRHDVELDVKGYGALIKGFCIKGFMRGAHALFNELLQLGLTPDTDIYNNMIIGFVNLKNVDAAFSVYKKMHDDQILCNLVTYTTLIDASLKTADILLASELYTEMLARGISPDTATLSSIKNGFFKKVQPEDAHRVMEEMNRRNMPPNVLIYEILIIRYFKEGNTQEAFRLYDELLDRGLKIDERTLGFVVSSDSEEDALDT